MTFSAAEKDKGGEKKDFDLTCWYLNVRRIVELVGADQVVDHVFGRPLGARASEDHLARVANLAATKDALVGWMRQARPPTLGQLVLSGQDLPGRFFTHYSNFYCRGLPEVRKALDAGRRPEIRPLVWSKLTDLGRDTVVRLPYDYEHLTSNSSWEELSRHKRLFVAGFVDSVSEGVIQARPYVMATPISRLSDMAVSRKRLRWESRLEVGIGQIDSFARVNGERPTKKNELRILKDIKEVEIKSFRQ